MARALRTRNRSLADQLERAASSIALNLAEGNAYRDGNRRARFTNALGSLRETQAAVQVAEARGHVDAEQAAEALAGLHRLGGMVWRLARR